MESFYNTYRHLLLELSYSETVKRMDDPKFKRLITGKESFDDMNAPQKHEYGTLRSTIIKSVPHDIPEKDKANALNWIITRIIKDDQKNPENRSFLRGPGGALPLSGGREVLRRHLEIFYQIKQQKMDRLLSKKAIEQYSSFKEFVDTMEEVTPKYREYLEQKTEKSTKGEGQLKIYEDDNWQIFFPQTKGAACALGKNTDWCTAAPGLDYYDSYAKQGQLIIFVSKNNPEEKYQFQYETGQFMDREDEPVNENPNEMIKFYYLTYLLDEVLKKNPEASKYLSKKAINDIIGINDQSEIVKIDKDHILYTQDDYESRDTFTKYIINTSTLKQNNPYGDLVSIRYTDTKNNMRRIYFYSKKSEYTRIHWFKSKLNDDETVNIIHRDLEATEYTNIPTSVFYDLAYFNTFKDVPESKRPEKGDRNYFAKINMYENTSTAKMVPREELDQYRKYTDFGIESIRDLV